MGLGSSTGKEKQPPPKRVVSVENEIEKKPPPKTVTTSTTQHVTQIHDNNSGWGHTGSNKNGDTGRGNTGTNNRQHSSDKNNRTNTQVVQNFESDSSDEDDIDAVLQATKNQYNNKIREQNRFQENNNEVSYPESYAQRLQRQQYKHEPQGIMRQKTIYRNPDDWNVDSKHDMDSFDVSRFQEANANKPQPPSHVDDTYPAPGVNSIDTAYKTVDPTDHYYALPQDKKKSLPRYDTSEEALLAEIEQEFEL